MSGYKSAGGVRRLESTQLEMGDDLGIGRSFPTETWCRNDRG